MVHDHVQLLLSHLGSISSPAVREAYLYLTHFAATLGEYECRPQDKGDVRDFRYYQRDGGEQPFSFIVNQTSLLWYFRKPGRSHPAARLSHLREQFSEVKENERGEVTVRISSLEDARRMMKLLQA